MGFGRTEVSSASLVPSPPVRMTTFIAHIFKAVAKVPIAESFAERAALEAGISLAEISECWLMLRLTLGRESQKSLSNYHFGSIISAPA
jgi:hypothetical protein